MKRFGILLAAAVLITSAAPARADVTAFLGANTTPSNRVAKGIAVGMGLLVIGLEFEYSSTVEDPTAGAPALRTGMGNVLLQTPVAIFGFQPYFTIGGGIYRETLADISDTGFGLNTGGGVKISLLGPVKLRVDYRVFTLRNTARATPAHRVYAGLNLGL